jgi:hypothetical protein
MYAVRRRADEVEYIMRFVPHRPVRKSSEEIMSSAHRTVRRNLRVSLAALLAGLAAPAAGAQRAPAHAGDWAAVDQALGRKGTTQPGGVMKYGFPRSDLHVTAGGVQVKPALALGSGIAFEPVGGGRAMMMGDLVLTEAEVGPAMQALQRGGVEQSALHNHLLGESPHVMYMHVSAIGEPAALARTVRTALGTTRTPLEAPAAQAATAATIELDTAAIAHALGASGKVNGGVYQVSVPRRESIRMGGHVVPPSMGVATGLNFQPTGGGKAAITGDFVLTSAEVNPVIRALREHGITPTALHSHMLGEEPRLYFMHFWANDDAATLARGLRAALDRMATKSPAAGR